MGEPIELLTTDELREVLATDPVEHAWFHSDWRALYELAKASAAHNAALSVALEALANRTLAYVEPPKRVGRVSKIPEYLDADIEMRGLALAGLEALRSTPDPAGGEI